MNTKCIWTNRNKLCNDPLQSRRMYPNDLHNMNNMVHRTSPITRHVLPSHYLQTYRDMKCLCVHVCVVRIDLRRKCTVLGSTTTVATTVLSATPATMLPTESAMLRNRIERIWFGCRWYMYSAVTSITISKKPTSTHVLPSK